MIRALAVYTVFAAALLLSAPNLEQAFAADAGVVHKEAGAPPVVVPSPPRDGGTVAVPSAPSTQQPAPGPDLDKDPSGWAKQLMDQIHTSNWRALIILLLVGLVWLARKFGGRVFPFFNTRAGGAILVTAGAFLGALINAAIARTLSLSNLLDAAVIAGAASGWWNLPRELASTPAQVKQP